MGTADIANVFRTLDSLTENQLRMVRQYAADLLSEKKTARLMASRRLQNAPAAEASEAAKTRSS